MIRIANKKISLKQFLALIIYYGLTRYLPNNNFPIIGKFCGKIRALNCRYIFKRMANNAHVWRNAYFALGIDIEIGEESSLGVNCVVPDDIIIGNNVMMGPNCYIFHAGRKKP